MEEFEMQAMVPEIKILLIMSMVNNLAQSIIWPLGVKAWATQT